MNRFSKALFGRNEDLKDSFALYALAYRLYGYEELQAASDIGAEYEQFMADKDYIEGLFEFQNEDGSVTFEANGGVNEAGSIQTDIAAGSVAFQTALYTSLMCIASRVYDEVDSLFARECMHASLEAGLYLLNNTEGIVTSDYASLLLAFCELIRTDYEIRNAYDHSVMAGMPQKMSRQRKYKMQVNAIIKDLTSADVSVTEGDEYKEFMTLSAIAALFDEGDNATDVSRSYFRDMVFDEADKIAENIGDNKAFEKTRDALIISTGIKLCEQILKKDSENASSAGAQLIKVVEYSIIQNEKKLSDEEKNEIKERLRKYEGCFRQ